MRYFFLVTVLFIGFANVCNGQLEEHNNSESSNIELKAYLVPAGLMTLGLLSFDGEIFPDRETIYQERQQSFSNFSSNADNYLQYSPIAIVYGLDAFGLEGRDPFWEKTSLLIKSELIMAAIVFPMKELTAVERPNGENFHSFPSGHTAQAFTAATFMHKQYGHISIWYSILAYSLATSVGVLRVLNNKHWSSDVLFGAGVGILSVNLADHFWNSQKQVTPREF